MDYYDPSLQAALSAVPIPPDAQPAAGPDAEITIYQPSSDTLWKMFDMRRALAPPPFLLGVVATVGSLPGDSTTTRSPR